MMCNKKVYTCKKYAKIDKRKVQVKFGGKYDVYNCPLCTHWHITTRKSAKAKSEIKDILSKQL